MKVTLRLAPLNLPEPSGVSASQEASVPVFGVWMIFTVLMLQGVQALLGWSV